jgi:hypothetical protein
MNLKVSVFRAALLLLRILSRRLALIVFPVSTTGLLIYETLTSKEVAD